jgi:putative adhesin
MRLFALNLAFSALLLSTGAGFAQSDTVWDKSYSVAAQPTLVVSVGDSQLNIHSCTSCQAVHIHVTAQNTSLSRYTLEESQSGDAIHFSLKEKPSLGVFHTNWNHSWVHVDVETPAQLTLDASCADGNLTATDLHGNLNIHTSDGNQVLERISGDLKLRSSDGHLRLNSGAGNLEAKTSDGNLDISGAFTALQLHSSDGSITIELAEGSRLNAESRIESHDGSVSLRLPKSFSAELAVSSSDGSIESNLPLVVEGYNSNGNSGHAIHGKFNGGGSLLTIHTSDGSVHLATL